VICVRDESVHGNTSIDGPFQSALDVHVIKSEDGDLNSLLSPVDLFDQRAGSMFGLD